MAELIKEERIKKTRKNHLCHGCREIIPHSSPAVASTNKDGGDFFTIYFCVPCHEFLQQWPEYCCDPYDDVYEGAIAEGMKRKAEDDGLQAKREG